MAGLLALTGVAFAVFIMYCAYYRYIHPLSRYPGPFLASFSDLWKFFAFFGGKHHLIEQALHDKYGHVVRTGPTSLSFSDLADFDAIYGFNKSMEKGDFYNFAREDRQLENVFSSRTDVSHREHRRKVVGPAMSASKVATYEPIVSKNVSVLVSRLQDLTKETSTVNIANTIHRYTFDTTVEVIFGDTLSSEPYTDSKASAGVLHAFRMMSKMAWGTSILPWLGWLMSTRPMVNLVRKPTFDADGKPTSMTALVRRTQEIVISHSEETIKSSQFSAVRNYLSVPKDNLAYMLPYEVWRESFNLTFAGPGSTAAALTAVLHFLGKPGSHEWQTKIRSEERPNSTSISLSPLLIAVIKETLRLQAPFPTAFPRIITSGAESSLPSLPAPLPIGTTISAHTYILGRSKALWGEDADMWKPERWLEAKDESEKRELDEKFVAFSKGPRGCIGKDIAMLMIARATVGVLDVWNVRSVGDLEGNSWLEMQYDVSMIELTRLEK